MARDEPRLENQLCFPLYACSRAITRAYGALLKESGLTYTQYITMMALWEYGPTSVGELGRCLMLDSGTLTPLLKKLAARGLIERTRDTTDERRLVVTLTPEGEALEDAVAGIPGRMACDVGLSPEEGAQLVGLLRKVMAHFAERGMGSHEDGAA